MPSVSYDKQADVLYVAWENMAAVKGTETADGMVRRYDHAGNIIGITVLDFTEWLKSYVEDKDLDRRQQEKLDRAIR